MNIANKLVDYKIMQYGKIAVRYRRGMITFDEMMKLMDDTEGHYLSLLESVKNLTDPLSLSVFEAGLDSLK